MNTTELSAKLNEKLHEFQIYVTHLPKDHMFAFLAIFIGLAMIIIAAITWP